MAKSFFKFFNLVSPPKKCDVEGIQFGKYSDRNKTPEQLQNWKDSFTFFNKKEFLKSLENFFKYIKDPQINNLEYTLINNRIEFNFFQGSKRIFGEANSQEIYAYSEILKFKELNNDFFNYILKQNHNLKFTKYIIDEKNKTLILKMLLKTEHSNPITLYSALREIAVIADKYDDLLLTKYPEYAAINTYHILDLEKKQVEIKIKYFRKWLSEVQSNLKNYDTVKFAGARSFLILNFVFKVHYLLSPEGELLEEINEMYEIYYKADRKTEYERNALLSRKLTQMSEWSDEQIKKSLYLVLATFPVSPPIAPKEIIKFMTGEISKVHWYINNDHRIIAREILEYIIGHCCYSFGVISIIDEIFSVFWQVMSHEYFAELGFTNIPVVKKSINYVSLNQMFSKINTSAVKNYPNFYFNTRHLNIESLDEFALSFIYELINCDFSQK